MKFLNGNQPPLYLRLLSSAQLNKLLYFFSKKCINRRQFFPKNVDLLISIVEWQHSKLKLSALNLTLSVIGCCLVEQWIQAAGGIWWKFKCILIITLLQWGAGQSSNSTCLHFHPPLNASNLPEFPDPFFGGFLVSKKWFGELDTSYVTWHVSKKLTFYFPTHRAHFTELLSALNFADENKECFLSGSFFEKKAGIFPLNLGLRDQNENQD